MFSSTLARAWPVTLALLGLPAVTTSAEFRGVRLALRGSWDVGSVSVPGTEAGVGAGLGVRAAFGAGRVTWEIGLDHDIAGYTGSGDGDPILQLALLVSRRSERASLGKRSTPYWSVATGVGALGLGATGVTLPLRGALGVSLFSDKGVGLDLAVFERFLLIHGGGSPSLDFLNGIGLELTLRFGR
jgi:hypothetical protein